jgi:hypothetical protein
MLVKVKGLNAKLPLNYLGVFFIKIITFGIFLKKSFDFVDLEVGRELDNLGLPPPSTSTST